MSFEGIRNILSINFNHDGAGIILCDGVMCGFVTTERFSRKKKHPGLREADFDELLDQAGLTLEDLDHVVLCNLHCMDSADVARLHGSDLKETWLEFWINQRNDSVRIRGRSIPCTVNPDHHTLHAAVAFFTSAFESAMVLTIDPTGCRAFIGRDNRLFPLRRDLESRYRAHIGYCAVAEELFGSSIVGAGKVMGMAPYGRPQRPSAVRVEDVADFAALMRLAEEQPVPMEVAGRELNAALAYYVQLGLEQQMCGLLAELAPLARRNGVEPALCLSGGTALNAVATELAFRGSRFDRLHLHPACGDDGTAIGAALWLWHHELGHPRREYANAELMYSVRTYGDGDVERGIGALDGRLRVERTQGWVDRTADLVAAGRIVGWFDGASEVGPRALGHRSIVADPRRPDMPQRLNDRVKFREAFRPFAPSVLAEHAHAWFGVDSSPFMLRALPVLRDGVPAITHVDGTARIQTVERRDVPAFHDLIHAFHQRTGVPMVVNTSLNVKGEPIVETPRDALDALLGSDLEYVTFPGYVVGKA